MLDINKTIMQMGWQDIVKLSVVVIVFFYTGRAIYQVHTAKKIIGMTSSIVNKQNEDFKKLHSEANVEINKVEDGLSNGAKEMEKNVNHLGDKFANFAKEFSESLEAEKQKGRERHRIQDIREFLDGHFSFYDKALYEADRKKFIEEKNHEIPDYEHYNELRNAAVKCHIARHNQYIETAYKNKIAQLEAEHQFKMAQSIPKPKLWKWPFSHDQLIDLKMDTLNHVFDVLTLEGQCRGV